MRCAYITFLFVLTLSWSGCHLVGSDASERLHEAEELYRQGTSSNNMQFAILSIIGASDSDMGILLNVQKQTIYHRRQIVRKHVNPAIDDIDAWLRKYVLSI